MDSSPCPVFATASASVIIPKLDLVLEVEGGLVGLPWHLSMAQHLLQETKTRKATRISVSPCPLPVSLHLYLNPCLSPLFANLPPSLPSLLLYA